MSHVFPNQNYFPLFKRLKVSRSYPPILFLFETATQLYQISSASLLILSTLAPNNQHLESARPDQGSRRQRHRQGLGQRRLRGHRQRQRREQSERDPKQLHALRLLCRFRHQRSKISRYSIGKFDQF